MFAFSLGCLKPTSTYLSARNNLPSLRLPKSPFGTCVIHLIIIGYDFSSRDTAEQLLLDNTNKSVWTVSQFLKNKYRKAPNPILDFQEECAITVFSDKENPFSTETDWDLMKNSFIADSLYAFLLRGKNSIFLILRFYCQHPVTGNLRKYPISIFIHYMNCDSQELSTERFPGFVLNQRVNENKRRKQSYSFYSAKEITLKEEVYINFLATDRIDKYVDMDCTSFHMVSLKNSEIPCPQDLYLAQHLSLKMNFSFYYYHPENLPVVDNNY